MTTAPRCSHSPCRRLTRDPSGRCQDHRLTAPRSAIAANVPAPKVAAQVTSKPSTIRDKSGRPLLEEYRDEDGNLHREDGPATITFGDEGETAVLRMRWMRRGKLHREGGPALVEYYSDGTLRTEGYYRDGVFDREDGPADTSYRADGSVSYTDYYRDGERHREDGPAMVAFAPDGRVHAEVYLRDGKKHRDDGPAEIGYLEDGTVKSETYRFAGQIHRVGGPAATTYYPDGSVSRETYRTGGVPSRIEGPAIIRYDEGGGGESKSYYLADNEYGSHEKLLAAVSNFSPKQIAKVLHESPFAELLDEGVDPYRIVDTFREGILTAEGVRMVVSEGTPPEWVRAFESGRNS